MQISVNAEPCEIVSTTLDSALSELGYNNPSVATALNGEFVPRIARTQTALKEGDRLEILAPMQGG